MFDALLYCHVMADIRHGYFLIVADFVRTITAEFRALWAKTLRAKTSGRWCRLAEKRQRRKPWRNGGGACRSLTGNARPGRRAWRELETYVSSMA